MVRVHPYRQWPFSLNGKTSRYGREEVGVQIPQGSQKQDTVKVTVGSPKPSRVGAIPTSCAKDIYYYNFVYLCEKLEGIRQDEEPVLKTGKM